MNNKIPFNQFAALMARTAGMSAAGAEAFVKEFFSLIAENLLNNEKVTVKGLGTFEPTGDNEQPVKFIPDADLAESVNAPFSLFRPEELNPEVTDEMINSVEIDDIPVERPAVPTVKIELDGTEDELAEGLVSAEEPAEERAQAPAEEPASAEEPAPAEEPAEELAPAEHSAPIPAMPTPPPYRREAPAKVETPAPVSAYVDVPASEPAKEEIPEPVNEAQPAVVTTDEPAEKPHAERHESHHYHRHRSKGPGFKAGMLIGLLIGVAVGACAVFFYMTATLYNGRPATQSSEASQLEVQYLEEQLNELGELPELGTPADSAAVGTPQ